MSRMNQGLIGLLGAAAVSSALFAACGGDEEGAVFTEDGGTDGSSSGASGASGSSSGTSGINGNPDATASGGLAKATPVDVVFTTDNAYVFGWGSKDSVSTLQGKPSNPTGNEIFPCPIGQGPEAYVVPAEQAPLDGYLYVIAWDDHDNTQGALGQFKRRETDKAVYTGDLAWEVCATGIVYDARSPDAEPPTLEVVNTELARCTAGTGDPAKTSAGWVNTAGAITANAVGKLTIGEDNSSDSSEDGGVFPITCQMDDAGAQGIDPGAHWMWYSSDGTPHFQNDPDPRSFLIFRLPNTAVPPPPVN